MEIQLPIELSSLLAYVKSRSGIRVESEQCDQSFGDAAMIMSCGEIRLRFVRDRNEWSIQLSDSSQKNDWYDIPIVSRLFQKNQLNDIEPLSNQCQFLIDKFDEIVKLFGEKEISTTVALLENYRHHRMARRIPGILKKKSELR